MAIRLSPIARRMIGQKKSAGAGVSRFEPAQSGQGEDGHDREAGMMTMICGGNPLTRSRPMRGRMTDRDPGARQEEHAGLQRGVAEQPLGEDGHDEDRGEQGEPEDEREDRRRWRASGCFRTRRSTTGWSVVSSLTTNAGQGCGRSHERRGR
jgi:hypothetical protein